MVLPTPYREAKKTLTPLLRNSPSPCTDPTHSGQVFGDIVDTFEVSSIVQSLNTIWHADAFRFSPLGSPRR